MSIEPIKAFATLPVNSARQSSTTVSSTHQQPFAALLGAASSAQSAQSEARDASAMAQMAKLQLLQGLFNPSPNTTQDSLSALLTMAVRRFEQTTITSQEVDAFDAALPEPASSLPASSPGSREQIDQLIDRVARQVNLTPELIRSVVSTESNFNPNAVSAVGAQGLMQLMPATARELEVSDSFDPQQNLLGGSRYLKQMLDKYDGDLDQALAAYNWGPGNVDRKGLAQMPQETRDYLVKVKQGLTKQTT